MLYVFGFEQICVVVSDLYFLSPDPGEGQEGAERGVRLEVRKLERGDMRGGVFSAVPISVEEPIWRGDLLETVAGPIGSFDRTHHHPGFAGWEPGYRVYVEELSADPLGWIAAHLSDLDGLMVEAGVPGSTAAPGDADALRAAVPEILDAIRRLLDGIRAGRLAQAPPEPVGAARTGWL
jgi:hypothetical protein